MFYFGCRLLLTKMMIISLLLLMMMMMMRWWWCWRWRRRCGTGHGVGCLFRSDRDEKLMPLIASQSATNAVVVGWLSWLGLAWLWRERFLFFIFNGWRRTLHVIVGIYRNWKFKNKTPTQNRIKNRQSSSLLSPTYTHPFHLSFEMLALISGVCDQKRSI